MASAMHADSDDEELLKPSFTTNAFTVTAEMIDNVLSVCPGVDREDIIKDLQYTNNISTTINRILDGRVTSAKAIQLSTHSATTISSTAATPKDNIVCLSDTDIDTDTESDKDNDNHYRNDVAVIESLSSPFKSNYQSKHMDKQKITGYTSDIIDLSFDDDDDEPSTRAQASASSSNYQKFTFKNTLSQQEIQPRNSPSRKEVNIEDTYSLHMKNECKLIQLDDQDSNTCETRLTDVSLSDSDTESLPSVIPSLRERMMSSSDMEVDVPTSQAEPAQEESVVIPKKKKKCSSEETQQKKEETQQIKAAKEAEKQAKKETMLSKKREKEMEKLSKKAESMNQKNLKKEECLQNIQVNLDSGLLSSPILEKLSSLGVTHNVDSHLHPVPDSVTWTRTHVVHYVGEDFQIHTEKNISDESHVIVRITSDWFISMVDAYIKSRSGYSAGEVGENSFQEFSRKLSQAYPNKSIAVVVFELDKYFRSVKAKSARNYRNAVRAESDSSDTIKSRKKTSPPSVIVSQIDVQEFLVFVELTSDLKVTLCESLQEFADTVAMFTKAVAEAPFKRSQPEAFSFCVDTTKSSVKVSKDGQGLVKLWQQQLQQFHNVSSNVAAAIVGAYPSPLQLMQGYKSCANEHSAALLLKDIMVRRGVGVLETSRRIGPELSRQIYLLFNSTNGNAMTK